MRLPVKYIIFYLIVVTALLTGWWLGAKKEFFSSQKTESTAIMLESVKKVTKLIAIEARFTEIYDYRENYTMDIFNLFSKKALLRVTAKASVGYDFEKLNISFDSLQKVVTLNEWPKAEVLSIDHDLDYYDITQGTFNKFTKEEYNMMNKKAKELILQKAQNADIFRQAEQQRDDYLFMLELALKNVGWKLHLKPNLPLQG